MHLSAFFSLTHSLICHNFYAIWQFKFTNHDRAKKGARRDRDGGEDKDEDDVKSSAVVDRVPLISRLQDRELQEMRDDGERRSTREIGSENFRTLFSYFFPVLAATFILPILCLERTKLRAYYYYYKILSVDISSFLA